MDSFVGEIRIFGFTWTPADWAACDGSTVPMTQYQALASVIGTNFGTAPQGQVRLPDFRGFTPVGFGAGPGLTTRNIGARFGAEGVTLTADELGAHTHTVAAHATTNYGSMTATPTATSWLSRLVHPATPPNPAVVIPAFNKDGPTNTALAPVAIGAMGSGASHENRQPGLAMNFCISLLGEYPVRP